MLIDGSPEFVKKLIVDLMPEPLSGEAIQIALLKGIFNKVFPNELIDISSVLEAQSTWDERVERILDLCKDQHDYSPEYLKIIANAILQRINIVLETDFDMSQQIKSSITLVKPMEVSVMNIDVNYGLQSYTRQNVISKIINGNHMTMLQDKSLGQIINEADPAISSYKAFKKHVLL